MKVIVNGYAAMIDDMIATTSLKKDGFTSFCTQSEIKKRKNCRPIIYMTEQGAKAAINHDLGWRSYSIPEEKVDELRSKSKVVRVTATYEIDESGEKDGNE